MTPFRLILGLAILAAVPASAQDTASASDISAAIAGNTVRGAMVASGGFEEYYGTDGSIRGADYAGAWSVAGNRLCLAYDGNPASCWSVRLSGRNLVWVGASGDEGTGVILPGNPNNF